ncbi:MAG: 1-acyl-sn-glycerol-3-phosphate acyltransferase [Fidelibacterota bacterium]|nr:MAG: 1-acyl-sn-glycerol-3-phosphate acyltransferase [Candidatus Neomarinimicrobiota bacterium]
MKWLRMAWIYFHVAAATTIFGSLTMLTAPFDRSKRFIGWHPRLWARWILWSTGLPIIIRGKELLQKGRQYIYMSNHSSALDIPLALAVLPGTVVFMAKKELFRILFFGWSMWAAGYIPVDRSNAFKARQSMDRALKAMKTKAISLILYPEGTRTDDGRLLPFKRGVFHIALHSRLPLVPVAVHGSFEAMPPNAMSLTHTPIQVTIGQPIETKALTDKDCTQLLKDAHDRIQSLLDSSST